MLSHLSSHLSSLWTTCHTVTLIVAALMSQTDDKYAQMLEAKALQNAAQGVETKDGPSRPGKRKDKRTPLNLPLKWSIKGEPKGPLSIFLHVNSVFIVCECTIAVFAPTSESNLFPLWECCSLFCSNFFCCLIIFCFLRRRPHYILILWHLPSHHPESPHSSPNQSKTPVIHSPPCPLS